jgi:hypothetical protein
LSTWRQGPDSSSAAVRKIAARSSNDIARQAGAAARAASIAAWASACVAPRIVPSTWRRACGWTTSMGSPPPNSSRPPIVIGRSVRCPVCTARTASTAARSGLPGA